MEQLHLDEACWKLLKGLSDAPKTPQTLSRIYGMPITDTWRRIRFLEGLGLIRVVLTFLDRHGRPLYFYQSRQPLTLVPDEPQAVYFDAAWSE